MFTIRTFFIFPLIALKITYSTGAPKNNEVDHYDHKFIKKSIPLDQLLETLPSIPSKWNNNIESIERHTKNLDKDWCWPLKTIKIIRSNCDQYICCASNVIKNDVKKMYYSVHKIAHFKDGASTFTVNLSIWGAPTVNSERKIGFRNNHYKFHVNNWKNVNNDYHDEIKKNTNIKDEMKGFLAQLSSPDVKILKKNIKKANDYLKNYPAKSNLDLCDQHKPLDLPFKETPIAKMPEKELIHKDNEPSNPQLLNNINILENERTIFIDQGCNLNKSFLTSGIQDLFSSVDDNNAEVFGEWKLVFEDTRFTVNLKDMALYKNDQLFKQVEDLDFLNNVISAQYYPQIDALVLCSCFDGLIFVNKDVVVNILTTNFMDDDSIFLPNLKYKDNQLWVLESRDDIWSPCEFITNIDCDVEIKISCLSQKRPREYDELREDVFK